MRQFNETKIQILHGTLAGRVSYLLNVPTQRSANRLMIGE